MSSRNRYLSPDERLVAPALYKGLKQAQVLFNGGERNRTKLLDACTKEIIKNKGQIEYLSLAEPFSLNEVDVVTNEGAIMSGAIKVGKTRIIDNVLLGISTNEI